MTLSAHTSRPRGVRILGIRGVPGRHGGFESFAEDLAPYLAGQDWDVSVYCQEEGSGPPFETTWRGVRRIHIPVRQSGALGTVVFDFRATRHAIKNDGLALILGYNTALFSIAYRLSGIPTALNMDGVEWKRQKYNLIERLWFLLNERLSHYVSDHLIADHPEIASDLMRRVAPSRVSTIPYGAREVLQGDPRIVERFNLTPGGYLLVIARPEPENSLLQVVRAFGQARRPVVLAVVGQYSRGVRYERRVLEAATDQVKFLGPIYDREVVDALRCHAKLYIHGHTVGGTNPALVEAMGAGLPVLAHDNVFNRWVAGAGASYFTDEADCARTLDRLLKPTSEAELGRMRQASRARHTQYFSLRDSLARYESVLGECAATTQLAARQSVRAVRSAMLALAICLICLGVVGCSSGVATRRIQSIPPLTQSKEDLEAGLQELTPGDVISINYPHRPEFNRDVIVRADGRITLPFLGAVDASGRTPEALKGEIQAAYASRAYSPNGQPAQRQYLINVGDVLEVRFRETDALNTTVKVRPDGRISLSLVKSVIAEGKSPEQLEKELIERYRGELKNPDLVVIVKEFTSDRVYLNGQLMRPGAKDLDEAEINVKSAVPRQIYVAGEVHLPGIVAYQPGLSALQAIAAAGGVPRSAQMNNVLILRRTPNATGQAIFVNLSDDLAARTTNDVTLRPFDVVIVPKTGIARVNDFLDQYLYQLVPLSRNINFSFFYDLRNGGVRIP